MVPRIGIHIRYFREHSLKVLPAPFPGRSFPGIGGLSGIFGRSHFTLQIRQAHIQVRQIPLAQQLKKLGLRQTQNLSGLAR